MGQTFVKLFSSILASTIWTEPPGTRLVWITMLAMSNAKGEVFASIPGLAKFAGVSVTEAASAIDTFLSPDRYSRDPANEGRRIEPIPGGWLLLNYPKFRELMNDEQKREKKRVYMQNYRKRVQKNTVNIQADSVNLTTKDVAK